MQTIEINKIEFTNKETEMFDLEVEDNHNFILCNDILSHNSGKSALGYHFLDLHHRTNRETFVYNFPRPELLPKFIKNTKNIMDLKPNSVLLIDEAALEFNQFSFQQDSTQELVNMMKVARHNDISIYFITQFGNTVSRDIRRLTDVFILRKPSTQQLYDEVSIIKRLYANCFMLFSTETYAKKGFYVFDNANNFNDMVTFELPEFWSEDLSKAYRTAKTTDFNIYNHIDKLNI